MKKRDIYVWALAEPQKKTLLTLVRTLKGRYPHAQVVGHRDCAPKACPCFDAKTEYKNV